MLIDWTLLSGGTCITATVMTARNSQTTIYFISVYGILQDRTLSIIYTLLCLRRVIALTSLITLAGTEPTANSYTNSKAKRKRNITKWTIESPIFNS